jgi:hypothetical protein
VEEIFSSGEGDPSRHLYFENQIYEKEFKNGSSIEKRLPY